MPPSHIRDVSTADGFTRKAIEDAYAQIRFQVGQDVVEFTHDPNTSGVRTRRLTRIVSKKVDAIETFTSGRIIKHTVVTTEEGRDYDDLTGEALPNTTPYRSIRTSTPRGAFPPKVKLGPIRKGSGS